MEGNRGGGEEKGQYKSSWMMEVGYVKLKENAPHRKK